MAPVYRQVENWQTCLPAGRRVALKIKICIYVYAIKSELRKYIYVGLTNNPERRIKQHNNKKEKTTRTFTPFKTILIEKYPTRLDARKREKYLKFGIGKEYLKSLL